MKIEDVVATLESFAPLPLQESYDNAGLQIGLTVAEVSGVLLCLDVTEEVICEAVEKGCNLIVAHHPLLFRPLRRVTDRTLPERCVRLALEKGVAIYAAHTNLDNAAGGVNAVIAERIGLEQTMMLRPNTLGGGSGLIGVLPEAEEACVFLRRLSELFRVECLMHNEWLRRTVKKVALCGGAGDFLLEDAVSAGADCFITGEMHYHLYMGMEQVIQIAVLGHYQSEQFTKELMADILRKAFPYLKLVVSSICTNPIKYLTSNCSSSWE